MSTFPPFTPDPAKYPKPVTQLVGGLPGATQTNSWAQSILTDPYPVRPFDRTTKASPWFFNLDYNTPEQTVAVATLSDMNEMDYTNTTTNGNLITQITQLGQANISFGNRVTLNNDWVISLNDGAYFARGSPFVVLSGPSTQTITVIKDPSRWVTATLAMLSSIPYGTEYSLTGSRLRTTVTNTSFIMNTSPQVVNELFFYNGRDKYTAASATASLVPGAAGDLTVSYEVITIVIDRTTVVPTIRSATGIIPTVDTLTGDRNQMTIRLSSTLSFRTNIAEGSDPKILSAVVITPQVIDWRLYVPAGQSLNVVLDTGSELVISGLPSLTGVKIASVSSGANVSSYSTAAGYATLVGGTVDTQFGGQFDYSVNWAYSGTGQQSQLLYLPQHYRDRYTFSGSDLGTRIFDPTYGALALYRLDGPSTAFVARRTYVIPLGPVLGAQVDVTNAEVLAERVRQDIALYNGLVLSPLLSLYEAGKVSSTYGRLLLLAKGLGIIAETAVQAAITNLVNGLLAWLTGNGRPQDFQILQDSIWGGVLVPADYYLSIGTGTNGSFGNSFYNDHHFQWGYLIYALYCAEVVRPGSILATQSTRVRDLILDYCNPETTTFSSKTRHKDWYSGHSWATGVVGDTNRQQESISEAINGYYAAYLMGTLMGDSQLSKCASAMMELEMSACELYAHLGADLSNAGIFERVNGASILQTLGKSFTTNFGGNPNGYPGKAATNYGIISLPFTEITPFYISTVWVTKIKDASYYFNGVRYSYALREDTVRGLATYVPPRLDPPNGITTYTPNPTPNETVKDEKDTITSSWGVTALMILATGGVFVNIPGDETSGNPFDTAYNLVRTRTLTYYSNDIPSAIDSGNSLSNILYYGSFIENSYEGYDPGNNPLDPVTVAVTEEVLAAEKCLKHSDDEPLVSVPTITVDYVTDLNNILKCSYKIVDIYYYSCGGVALGTARYPQEAHACELYTTVIKKRDVEFAKVVIGTGESLSDKAKQLCVSYEYLGRYAVVKFILIRLLYGKFSYNRLRRRHNTQFYTDLSNSRFYKFVEFFTAYLPDNGVMFNLSGYEKYFIE